jgi:hypothetical protein
VAYALFILILSKLDEYTKLLLDWKYFLFSEKYGSLSWTQATPKQLAATVQMSNFKTIICKMDYTVKN